MACGHGRIANRLARRADRAGDEQLPGAARDYLPSVVVERDGDLVIDQHHLDLLAGRSLSTRAYLRGGRSRRVRYSVRMFASPGCGTGCGRRASPRSPATAAAGSR